MRQPMVAGNWKLNGSQSSIKSLINDICLGASELSQVAIMVCPPYVYLPLVADLLQDSSITLGAQNVSEHSSGAFTGEVAADMLKDVGCAYTLIGHSERRAIYGEQDAVLAHKFVAAQKAGLTPVLCVGETLAEREAGQTESVVRKQLEAVLNAAGVQSFDQAIIAYEPVWAIGTGQTATPEQAQAVHQFIREHITQLDAAVAQKVRILYGGSVKADNAAELFAMPDIDGGLIGGASLKAQDFLAICRAGHESACAT